MTTFLFDLDQTLVDSSALAQARTFGQWAHVESNLHQVTAFACAPHALPARLRAAGHKVGIVTSSPRAYAEKVVKNFGIEFDALVAYHDTSNHNTLPDPINAAVKALSADPNDTVHIGDSPDDHEASFHAGIVSLGAGWTNTPFDPSRAPDLLLSSPEQLLEEKAHPLIYLADALSNGFEPVGHAGSVITCGAGVIALGRYFTTADARHARSSLSRNVLTLKDDDAPASLFANALARYLALSQWTPNYIVPVPPKPGQTRNRFASVLGNAALFPGSMVLLDGIICAKHIDGYKSMGPKERASAVQGAYVSKYSWNGARILLLDDVHTTGETADACRNALLAAGAGEVRTVVFAKDQATLGRELCPVCGSLLKIRTSVYGRFWGCTAWRREDPNSCQYKRDA